LGSEHATVEAFRGTETYKRLMNEWKDADFNMLSLLDKGRAVFEGLMQEAGFDKSTPEVVGQEEFDHLTVDSEHPILYRGTGESEGGQKQFDQFLHGDHFLGEGIAGSGSYASTRAVEAASYAQNGLGSITRMGIKPGARVVNINDLEREMYTMDDPPLFKKMFKAAWRAYDRDEVKGDRLDKVYRVMRNNYRRAFNLLRQDMSSWALMAGADVVKVSSSTYIVLNREALWVQNRPVTMEEVRQYDVARYVP